MAAPAYVTTAEYLALDEAFDGKLELREGVVYAMAGGTVLHALLSSRVARALRNLPRGCETYSSDLRITVSRSTYFYPDLTTICGSVEVLDEATHTVTNPTVVFEILSPSTESYDRGRKSWLYRTIPSLQAIVLISQDEPLVETIERQADESWVIRTFKGMEAIARLLSIDASITLGEIYDAIPFETEPINDRSFSG